MKIQKVEAIEILDSRGNPKVEVGLEEVEELGFFDS